MTQAEHPQNTSLALFLAFAGGALIGGAAAVLFAPRSGAETRQRIIGALGDGKDLASRLPLAVREASSAAQVAFAEATKTSAGEDAAISHPARHHS